MIPRDSGPTRRAGSAVVVVLLLMVVVVFASAAFVRVSGGVASRVDHSVDDRRAAALAEAGLREGVAAIAQGFSGNVGTLAEPAYLGQGVFWVEAEPVGDGLVQLVSTALVGSGRAATAAIVRAEEDSKPLFDVTLASKDTLTLNEGVKIDSYDSTLGTYASQVASSKDGFTYAGTEGDVKSNAGIALNANAHVFGDANPGPGYTVTKPPSGFVSGSTAAMTEPVAFPEIEMPPVAMTTTFTLATEAQQTLPPGVHGFSALTLQKASILTVQGPATLVVDSFSGFKDATLKVDATGGPVTIYVASSYFHDNGFKAEAIEGSPMALAFLIDAEQDITFPSKSKVQGAYYAPNASLTFTSSNEAWGSFVAKKVSMSNDMSFHYDENLGKYWEEDGEVGGDPVLAWYPTAIEPAFVRLQRQDPGVVLDVDLDALKSPADSWLP